jgi:hypothetical protein
MVELKVISVENSTKERTAYRCEEIARGRDQRAHPALNAQGVPSSVHGWRPRRNTPELGGSIGTTY